jgi:hypothetical protein
MITKQEGEKLNEGSLGNTGEPVKLGEYYIQWQHLVLETLNI